MEVQEEHTHYYGVDKAEVHVSVREAIDIFLSEIAPIKGYEIVSSKTALDRILYGDLISPIDIPRLPRSTRDGYAVSMAQNAPSAFNVVGDVRIGTIPNVVLKLGEAASIATGSFIPKGTASVVMKEYVEKEGSAIRVKHPVKPDENILKTGEDISKGQIILKQGTRIRPHHIALLSILGKGSIRVFKRPRVAFFSTGDELTDISRKDISRKSTSVYDSNRPFIHSMLLDWNADPIDLGIAKDDYKVIRSKFVRGLKSDALILSAGSSVGEKDFVVRAAEAIKGLKMLVHGVAMRPSSPTGLAVYLGKPVIFLPGFPTSTITSFLVFGKPVISKLSGARDYSYPLIRARIQDEYKGKAGITQYLRVRVTSDRGKYAASIVKPTEAQYSKWLSIANGVAVVEEESVQLGEEVDVFLIGDIIFDNGSVTRNISHSSQH